MKKWFLIFCTFGLICGCNKQEKTIEFSGISKELETLTTEALDYPNLIHRVEDDLEEMETLTEDQVEATTGISSSLYEQLIMRVSKKTGKEFSMYLVVQSKKENQNTIKEKMKVYFENLIAKANSEEEKKRFESRMELEYGDNLIYVMASSPKSLVEKIKDAKEPVFSDMHQLDLEEVEHTLQVTTSDIEKNLIYLSDTLEHPNLLIIIEPKKDHENEIEKKINNYFKKLEEEWKNRDLLVYESIQSRLEKKLGSYQIYSISKDNEQVYQMIESHYQ